jgi:hypothetical protein
MKLKYFLFLSVFIFLCKQNLSAQGNANWWLESSFSSKVQADSLSGKSRKLLFHGEANYSYSRLDGITSGNIHSGKMFLVERFKPFSHFTSFNITAQEIGVNSSTSSAIKTENYYFHDYFDIDFNKVLFVEPGFIWERNVVSLINSRHFIYIGIGSNAVLFKKIKFKSLAAITRVDQNYIIDVTSIDVVKDPYKAAYFNQEMSIQFNKDIMLSTQVGYFLNLDDSERYLYNYNVNLRVKLLKHIGLVVGYSSNFNSDNAIFNLEQINSMFNTGIQVTL